MMPKFAAQIQQMYTEIQKREEHFFRQKLYSVDSLVKFRMDFFFLALAFVTKGEKVKV